MTNNYLFSGPLVDSIFKTVGIPCHERGAAFCLENPDASLSFSLVRPDAIYTLHTDADGHTDTFVVYSHSADGHNKETKSPWHISVRQTRIAKEILSKLIEQGSTHFVPDTWGRPTESENFTVTSKGLLTRLVDAFRGMSFGRKQPLPTPKQQ
jgi:hypothetical protein